MCKTKMITCRECGNRVESKQAAKAFCSAVCRQTYNNRRLQRGAQLYDMFMAVRYQRDMAKDEGLWSVMCRLAEEFHTEDHRDRDGRQSWQDPREILAEKPYLRADRLGKVRAGR